MLFNSLEFVFFFPLVVVLYFATPQRFRWMLLLAGSYYFYACWRVEYLVLIWVSTLVDYVAALEMSKRETKQARRPWLIGSLVMNLGLLGFFKYFNFVSQSVQDAFASVNIFVDTPYLDVLLPVGISFYTFQTLSYTIDVYRGRAEAERHLGYFALYVSYFPQLVAGPIERAGRLIPQLRQHHRFDYDQAVWGLCKIAYGFFKKLVVADRLALFVNPIFAHPELATTWTVVLAGVFFAFQMYCDFSGYSDIAIGTARIMGIRLTENFRRPFLAPSMGMFWQRWHISLTTWLRDYLYGSIRGGRHVASGRRMLSTMAVFGAFGIWHGANWTFIVCGLFAGILVIVDQLTAEPRSRMWRTAEGLVARVSSSSYQAASIIPLPQTSTLVGALKNLRHVSGVLITFIQVIFLFIMFRADSVGDAFTMYAALAEFDFWISAGHFIRTLQLVSVGQNMVQFLLDLFLGVVAIGLVLLSYRLPIDLKFRHRTTFLVVTSILILLLGANASEQFIYFQF